MGKVTRNRPDGNAIEPRPIRSLAQDSTAVSRARARPAPFPQPDAATGPERRIPGTLPTPKTRHQAMTAQVADPLDSDSSISTQSKGNGASTGSGPREKRISTHDRTSAKRNALSISARRSYARMSAPDRPHIRTYARTGNVDGSDAEDDESSESLEDDDSSEVSLNPGLLNRTDYASHAGAVAAYLRISPTDPVHYQAYVNDTDFLTEPPTQQVTVTAAQRTYYQDQTGRQLSQQRLLQSRIDTEERGVTVRDVVVLLNQKHELENGVTLRRVKTLLGAKTYIEIPCDVVKS